MNKTTAVATQYGTLSDGRGPRAICRWIRTSGGPRHSHDRLPLLVYARSEPARISALLYRDGGRDWLPLQMLRTHVPMLVEHQGRQWYFYAHILPVKKGRRYGL